MKSGETFLDLMKQCEKTNQEEQNSDCFYIVMTGILKLEFGPKKSCL